MESIIKLVTLNECITQLFKENALIHFLKFQTIHLHKFVKLYILLNYILYKDSVGHSE